MKLKISIIKYCEIKMIMKKNELGMKKVVGWLYKISKIMKWFVILVYEKKIK